jgi:hypothetical protein
LSHPPAPAEYRVAKQAYHGHERCGAKPAPLPRRPQSQRLRAIRNCDTLFGSATNDIVPVLNRGDAVHYRNSEMKIDQLVSYLNEEKINLAPAFQRGHVWTPKARRQLLKNMVLGRPIPAVFLYKEASGSKYSYNILDGKQRLESLILFVASDRSDLRINNWSKYFFGPQMKTQAGFKVPLPDGNVSFKELEDSVVRDFREYAIPTIEITLDDESSLDEIITLFVDINQQGEPVKRFDIVKAMCKGDALLKSVFSTIAIQQRRGHDVFYKPKKTDIAYVLKGLNVISAISSPNSKVDKMWEKFLELCLFYRSKQHRKPVEILKGFIAAGQTSQPKLTVAEVAALGASFKYLRAALLDGKHRFATDQTHFYTLATAVIGDGIADKYSASVLGEKLKKFDKLLEGPPSHGVDVKKYRDLSTRQTTDIKSRNERTKLFLTVLHTL